MYSVVAADGWFGIAQKLGVSPARLMAVNGATAETIIHPAQMITVPDPDGASPIAQLAVSPVRPGPRASTRFGVAATPADGARCVRGDAQ